MGRDAELVERLTVDCLIRAMVDGHKGRYLLLRLGSIWYEGSYYLLCIYENSLLVVVLSFILKVTMTGRRSSVSVLWCIMYQGTIKSSKQNG